jgi:hypothetical protein
MVSLLIMPRIFTKIQSAVYGATVVANARYRDDVLNLQANELDLLDITIARPFPCRNVFRIKGL